MFGKTDYGWNSGMLTLNVRHRSRATHSRQPRQVRKEATVTGSCVCSGFPVPGLFLAALHIAVRLCSQLGHCLIAG